MLPGKKYTPEDLVAILRRRIWVLLVPFALISSLSAVSARRLPNLYRSEATLQVVPQRVPEAIVRSTVTQSLDGRLQAIRQLILSRTRLERLIQELNLYPEERRTGIMEDIVEQMRREISVVPVQGDVFRVSFVGRDPRVVKSVAERLASMFIDESLTDRAVLAEGTDHFLESQLEEQRAQLIEQEKRLEDYKRRFSGELPTQADSNMQAGQNVQMQIQSLIDGLNRDQERRLLLERQLGELEAAGELGTGASAAAPPAGSAAQQLAQARRALAALEARRLTPAHPDIQQAQRVIRDLQRQAEAEALEAPVGGTTSSVSPAELTRQRRIEELRATLDQLDRQAARAQSEEKRLRGLSDTYQQRVEKAPTRESELVELTRDYATLRQTYMNLLAKKEEANISANLERLQIGEQFKILDAAQVPQRPFSPDRQRLRLMAMAAGLGLGLVWVGFLEYRDSTFKSDVEIKDVLSLPVLAVVPLMVSDEEERMKRIRWWIVNSGLACGVATCLAVLAYTFVR